MTLDVLQQIPLPLPHQLPPSLYPLLSSCHCGQQDPCPEPRSFPIIGRKLTPQDGVSCPPAMVWLPSFHVPLCPIAPEPSTASAPGQSTLTKITDTGVRQAGFKPGSTTYTLVTAPWSISNLPCFLHLVNVGNNICPTGLWQGLSKIMQVKFLAQC